jgi:phytoene dehydrogenase-like protein
VSILPRSVDAIVVGGGPNGLVAAAILADAGWSVLLLEEQDELGGAVKSRIDDGWTMDQFSACYPLAVASPIMRDLGLERHGLRWAIAETVLAHPLSSEDGTAAVIHLDREQTAANLGEEEGADGQAWLDLCARYDKISAPFLDAMLNAWPPVMAARRLARTLGGSAELLRFARFLSLPTHRMGEELFRGRRGRALLAGNAMHADAPADAPISGVMGWLLAMLAQDVGFPSPVGGAGQLTAALVHRARTAGADLRTGEPVAHIEVRSGAAAAVRTASGQTVRASKAIVGDVAATALYRELLAPDVVPATLRDELHRFSWDLPTVKINYRLRATPAWTAKDARSAGVVHAGADADGLVHWSADLNTRRIPRVPFALIGQMSTIDPTRSPDGTQAMWAHSHLPRGLTDDESAHLLAARVDEMLEAHAPGFASQILDRDVQTPAMLMAQDANLVGGAVGGGTSQLFQQLVFRPVPGLGGPRTVIDHLYLGSAAIHPGGGVHGACGALAARAALDDHGRLGALRRRASSAVLERLYRARPSAR